jgi:purine-binding chemotaxis protein CheW
MSKSVDETVFDFFSLLLHEEEQENEAGQEPGLQHRLPRAPEAVGVKKKLSEAVSTSKPLIAPPVLSKQALEQLLAPVLQPTPTSQEEESQVCTEFAPKLVTPSTQHVTEETAASQVSLQTQVGSEPPSITKDLQEQLDDEFQVLFFKIAGLTLAVPLVSLGGIVKIERVNHIIGRPHWFLGVQSHREAQLNIVDTCAWVMPEKYDEELAQTVNYQYLVLLEQSNWGLACESLVNAVRIKKSQVNWRSKAGKRPWLAGVVKEQMCGILHVQALIEMLDLGLGCQDPLN